MRFISLIDTKNQNVITINADSSVLRLEMSGVIKEKRISPYVGSILYQLFKKHPQPVHYQDIISILKEHHLMISDDTRMHRKLSEVRRSIEDLHPSLEDFILNTRGIGYSLPLRLKNLHHIDRIQDMTKFSSMELTRAINIIDSLIHDAAKLIDRNKIIKHSHGYIIDRDLIRDILIEKILSFNQCEKIILQEIHVHEADFTALRINYMLAKLKTYVGLARISEYPISHAQWLDWFNQEVGMFFDELKKLIRLTESV